MYIKDENKFNGNQKKIYKTMEEEWDNRHSNYWMSFEKYEELDREETTWDCVAATRRLRLSGIV